MSTDATPPAWAEAILRAVLKPTDFVTVSGDLLEEVQGNRSANPWSVWRGRLVHRAGAWVRDACSSCLGCSAWCGSRCKNSARLARTNDGLRFPIAGLHRHRYRYPARHRILVGVALRVAACRHARGNHHSTRRCCDQHCRRHRHARALARSADDERDSSQRWFIRGLHIADHDGVARRDSRHPRWCDGSGRQQKTAAGMSLHPQNLHLARSAYPQ